MAQHTKTEKSQRIQRLVKMRRGFGLGEGWLALALMPLNNIANLVVISAKAIHLGWKKLIGASFAH